MRWLHSSAAAPLPRCVTLENPLWLSNHTVGADVLNQNVRTRCSCTDDRSQQRLDCVPHSESLSQRSWSSEHFRTSASLRVVNGETFSSTSCCFTLEPPPHSSSCRHQALDAQQLHPATSRRSSNSVRLAPPTLRHAGSTQLHVFVRRTWSRCESSGQTGL